MDEPKQPKPEALRSIRAEGNNPIDLASQVSDRVKGRGVPSIQMSSRFENLKNTDAPQAAKTAWEREQALSRGSQRTAGGGMRMIKVKSNSARSKTEIIDDVILHFDGDGVAHTSEGNREKLELFCTRRPNRISIEAVAPLAVSVDELLAAAQAAMNMVVPAEAPEAEEPEVDEPPAAVEEMKVVVASVGRDKVQPEATATKKSSKKK